MNYLHLISGGAGSWLAAKIAMRDNPDAEHRFLFTDVLYEDADCYRFLVEGVAYLLDRKLNWTVPSAEDFPDYRVDPSMLIEEYAGNPDWRAFLAQLREDATRALPELTWLVEGRDPWEVFRDVRLLGNSGMDPCSRVLKREIRDRWITEHCDPANTVITVGIGPDEAHRFNNGEGKGFQPRLAAAGWTAQAPLIGTIEGEIGPFVYLKQAGIKRPRLYDYRYSHANCFSGETEFMTENGIRRLIDCVGQTVKVLGINAKWTEATVHSFGEQELVRLRVERYGRVRDIFTTREHRWFVRNGRSGRAERLTHELRPGSRLASIFGQIGAAVRPSAFGISQGICFGDGTTPSTTNGPALVILCGEKDRQLMKWFPLSPTIEERHGVRVSDLPRTWKSLPDIMESRSFLYGWLSGYYAADGTVSGGQYVLQSAKRENLEFAQKVAMKLGIGTNPIAKEMRVGIAQTEPSALYSLALIADTLREDFFLIEAHRQKFLARPSKRPAEWRVISVEPTGRVEEVYCAVVPDGAAFALEGNILTGNCGGFCVKAGHAHYQNRHRVQRDRFEYDKIMEQKMREFLGADVSMLTDRTGGDGKKPLTLAEFEQRLLANPQIEFFYEPGTSGCGCAIDEDAA